MRVKDKRRWYRYCHTYFAKPYTWHYIYTTLINAREVAYQLAMDTVGEGVAKYSDTIVEPIKHIPFKDLDKMMNRAIDDMRVAREHIDLLQFEYEYYRNKNPFKS